MGTRKKLCSVDVISNLPSHVIDNILIRLPLRDAVRTSVLSKEWRFKWTYIPEIVFDTDLADTLWERDELERTIYRLLCHQGPINKFWLVANWYKSSPDLDNWILFLSKYKIRDLTIFISSLDDKHVMPSRFYTFQHLTGLSLDGFVFKPPPHFKGFSKLVTLEFLDVEMESAVFKQLMSQCLLLKTVDVYSNTKWDSVEVEGPSLKFFFFQGDFKSIRIKNATLLAQVWLLNRNIDKPKVQSSDFIESFGSLSRLENLTLNLHLLQLMGAGGIPYRFLDSFSSVTYLQLSIYFDSIEEVACALCLLRSSPNLKMLNVWLRAQRIEEAVTEFIQAQETPDRYLSQLRSVVIQFFSDVEAQLKFVRYLLASAGELEKMVIKRGHEVVYDNGGWLSLKNMIKQLPQAYAGVLIDVLID